MTDAERLAALFRAQHKIVSIVTHEEEDAYALVRHVATAYKSDLWQWSASFGLRTGFFKAQAAPGQRAAGVRRGAGGPGGGIVATSLESNFRSSQMASTTTCASGDSASCRCADARGQIFAIHLRKRKRDPDRFDLTGLAEAAAGFSGAEIEQAVSGALHDAFGAKVELTDHHIRAAVKRSPPLSVTMREKVAALREWSNGRCVAAD